MAIVTNDSNILSLFRVFITKLNSLSIPYALQRNYETLPCSLPENDIDLIIHKKNLSQCLEILENICLDFELNIHSIIYRQYISTVNIVDITKNSCSSVQIDFDYDFDWKGFVITSVDELLKTRVLYKGTFYILNIENEYLIKIMKSLLWGGFLKNKYIVEYQKFTAQEKKDLLIYIANKFSPHIINELNLYLEDINLSPSNRFVYLLRVICVLKSIKKKPLYSLIQFHLYVLKEIRLIIKPPGIILSVPKELWGQLKVMSQKITYMRADKIIYISGSIIAPSKIIRIIKHLSAGRIIITECDVLLISYQKYILDGKAIFKVLKNRKIFVGFRNDTLSFLKNIMITENI